MISLDFVGYWWIIDDRITGTRWCFTGRTQEDVVDRQSHALLMFSGHLYRIETSILNVEFNRENCGEKKNRKI